MGLVVKTAAVFGVQAREIEVQVDARRGLYAFNIVGLPDGAIREAKDRVEAALYSSGYYIPERHITVNLAPSDVRKEGSTFDLPIAIGLLSSIGLIEERNRLERFAVCGELSLNGAVRGIRGVLAVAMSVKERGLDGLIVPEANATEAAVVKDLLVIPVTHLTQVVQYLRGEIDIAPVRVNPAKLKVVGARMVWPKEQDLQVEAGGELTRVVIPTPPRYAALYMKLA